MKKRKKLRFAAFAALALSVMFGVSSLNAAPNLGGNKCENPGSTIRANNSRFICSPEGGQNVWRRLSGAGTVAETISVLKGLSTLDAALAAAELKPALSGAARYTIFAPTNAAFNSLPPGLLEKLLKPENKAALTSILLHHATAGRAVAKSLTATDRTMADGTAVLISLRGGVRIDNANVRFADIMAKNGVIHIINKVLIPPTFDPNTLK
jgi:uncharacterized surface protein with fasciclin (FAS1) repeats